MAAGLGRALQMCSDWEGTWAEQAAALEAQFRAQGFDPLLTASELRTLALLLAGSTAFYLAQFARVGGQPERSQALAAEGARLYSELGALHPGRPLMKLNVAMCLLIGPPSERGGAAAALREAFSQADASTGGRRALRGS